MMYITLTLVKVYVLSVCEILAPLRLDLQESSILLMYFEEHHSFTTGDNTS